MRSDTEQICNQVCDLAREVGMRIRAEVTKLTRDHIEEKGLHNYVTYVDRMSEQMLVEGLGRLLPEAGFIAEEETVKHATRGLVWVIDPLDGTTNFIHALPVYSVSIALMDGEELLLGVVYEINCQECFYAWKGSPSYLNGTIIRVSGTATLHDALLATGFPYTDYGRMEDYLKVLAFLLKNSRGLRRFGSAAVDLAYVACGRFDGFYEYGLNPWDVAAGALIVRQAGGWVSDFKGNTTYVNGKEIIASNMFIHRDLLDALLRFFV